MSNILTLMIKDFFEFKNNFLRFFASFIFMIFLPILMFNYMGLTAYILDDIQILTDIVFMGFIILFYVETTLFQVYRDMNDGIFEKHFINTHLKKYEIVISKFLTNLIISIFGIILMLLINKVIANFITTQFNISLNLRILISFPLLCGIGSTLAFLNSLILSDEKNATVYGISFLGIYFGYYKLLELLKINSSIIEYFGLLSILIILIGLVAFLLNNNRFIKRG